MTPDDLTRTNPPADATRDQSDAALDAGLAAAFGGDTTHLRPPSLEPETGTVIAGKYRLTEKVGEGGMGSVWVASQTEPVKRKVAVKLIKAGMDSKAVLARFEAERQALAVMDHPNIAKILDGGLHDGRPYFVMELVKGVPITEYCDARKLTPQQRLELFVPVCQAIQHAHQKGVIHRDIKPSNVLVALYDDRPVPKVIDFGIAKATGAALTEHTLETGIGAVVGTPAYMSPEQASLNNLDIDTRSDVYALGVLLYELLTGSPPFSGAELKKKGLLEILRVVREEEPPRPSHKLSTADALPSLSANRGTEPKKLTGLLRNELDWIVMKALEKDRTRRYDTANGFAADVTRYLSGEAVQAHPPSAGYRLKKFVRRNKGQVIAASLVFLALVVGIAGTAAGLFYADRQRQRAEEALVKEAEQRGRAEHARDRTRQALDAMTSSLTGDSLAAQKQLSDDQKEFLAEVLTYYREFAGETADDEKSRARTADAARRVGDIESQLGRLEQAKTAYSLARDGFQSLAREFTTTSEYRRGLAQSRRKLATVLHGLGSRTEAEEEFRTALAMLAELAQESPTHEVRYELASCHVALGSLLYSAIRLAESEAEDEKAVAIFQDLAKAPALPEYRYASATASVNLGMVLAERGSKAKAEVQYRKALDVLEKLAKEYKQNPGLRKSLGTTHHGLGRVLEDVGKLSEAEDEFTKSVAALKKLADEFQGVPDYQQELANSCNSLGCHLASRELYQKAEEPFRTALAIRKQLFEEFPKVPECQWGLASSHFSLGNWFTFMKKWEDAAEQYRAAILIQKALVDADRKGHFHYRWELARSHGGLGGALDKLKKGQDAEEQLLAAVKILEELAGEPSNPPTVRHDLSKSYANLALQCQRNGKGRNAPEHYRKALAIAEELAAEFKGVVAYQEELAVSHTQLGSALVALNDRPGAEPHFVSALAIRAELSATFPKDRRHSAALALAHYQMGFVSEEQRALLKAEESYRASIALGRKLVEVVPFDPAHGETLTKVEFQLAYLLLGQRKTKEALNQYAEALDSVEKLVKAFPLEPRYRVDLGGRYCNLGSLLSDMSGPAGESLKWYDKAMPVLEQAHKEAPEARFAKAFLRATCEKRGEARDRLQKHTEAIKDWDRAIELSEGVVQAGYRARRATSRNQAGQVAEAVADVVELTKSTNWGFAQWFDFACVYSVASGTIADKKEEYALRAMELLRTAVKEGWKDAAVMKEDPDMKPLLDRDDFKKLIAELEAKYPPKKEALPPSRADK